MKYALRHRRNNRSLEYDQENRAALTEPSNRAASVSSFSKSEDDIFSGPGFSLLDQGNEGRKYTFPGDMEKSFAELPVSETETGFAGAAMEERMSIRRDSE